LETRRGAEPNLNNRCPLAEAQTDVLFYTFLGKDAIEALCACLSNLKARGITLQYNDPLFIRGKSWKGGKKEGIETDNIQSMMKEVALRAGS
jgi:hypothetical protein